jgi:hypothetical protein
MVSASEKQFALVLAAPCLVYAVAETGGFV